MAYNSILTRSFWTIDKLALAPIILLFFTSFFLGTAAHRMVFYIASPLLGYSIFYAWKHAAGIFKTRSFILISAYLLYFLISGFWSEPLDSYKVFRGFVDGITILLFCSSMVVAIGYAKIDHKIIMRIATMCLIATISYCLYFYGSQGLNFDLRLHGLGRYTNPIHLSAMLVMAILLMMSLKLSHNRPLQIQIVLYTLFFLIAVFFSHTRSSLVGLMGCMGLIFLLQKGRTALLLVGGLGVAAAIGYFAWGQSFAELFERGDTFRLAIWRESFMRFLEHPLWGHGLMANPEFMASSKVAGYKSTHNVILGHLYHGGMVGFLIFALVAFNAFYVAVKSFWDHRAEHTGDKQDILRRFTLLSLSFCFLTSMFNFAHYAVGMHIQWLVFWVPVSLAWYLECSQMRRRDQL